MLENSLFDSLCHQLKAYKSISQDKCLNCKGSHLEYSLVMMDIMLQGRLFLCLVKVWYKIGVWNINDDCHLT